MDATSAKVARFLQFSATGVTGFIIGAFLVQSLLQRWRDEFIRNLRSNCCFFASHSSDCMQLCARSAWSLTSVDSLYPVNNLVRLLFYSPTPFFLLLAISFPAFVRGWEMTLVMLSLTPLFGIIAIIGAIAMVKFKAKDNMAHARTSYFLATFVIEHRQNDNILCCSTYNCIFCCSIWKANVTKMYDVL